MKQLRIMAAALFLISPFAAHGMFIEVTVEGTAHNFYSSLGDEWEYFPVSGSVMLEFSTADDAWIDESGQLIQYPTLYSYAFEWSAFHYDSSDSSSEFLASDSCKGGPGSWYIEASPVVKNPSWSDEPYYWDFMNFQFECGTPDSYMYVWESGWELYVNFFDIAEGASNHTMGVDVRFISEPGTLVLLCAGLIGMGFALRRNRA